MTPDHRLFYSFLGMHSLLIGLFPFYLPVFVWRQHTSLALVAGFIALGGLGFLFGLRLWDGLRQRITQSRLIALSFAAFALMMLAVPPAERGLSGIVLLALLYGFYQSLFWTTQRALFLELVTPANSGRAYGNFQLFVFAALQVGILMGGWILETAEFRYLLLLTVVLAVMSAFVGWRQPVQYSANLRQSPTLRLNDVLHFRDRQFSRTVFIVDGLFLFLESFFWVISLFLFAHESFTRLGAIVIVLAICFGALFYLLKNTVDRLGKRVVFRIAVCLYLFSWLLRAITNEEAGLLVLFICLVLITFCSSLFRLVFNKRFYDLAKGADLGTESNPDVTGVSSGHHYIVLKSYYTQAGLFAGFGLFALLAGRVGSSIELLSDTYLFAAALTPVYFLYGWRYQRSC